MLIDVAKTRSGQVRVAVAKYRKDGRMRLLQSGCTIELAVRGMVTGESPVGNPEMSSILMNEAGIVSPCVHRSLNFPCVNWQMSYTGNVIYADGGGVLPDGS